MHTQVIHLPPSSRSQAPQRWTTEQVEALYELPFADLMFRAQTVHRENFDANAIQRSTLLSMPTPASDSPRRRPTMSSRRPTRPNVRPTSPSRPSTR